MDTRDWDAASARLAARALEAGRPTAWFEELYAAGVRDEIDMPWDRSAPSPLLAQWLAARAPGAGAPAVVVGCGLGIDAELVAAHGFATTAFDISTTAIATARQRYPSSPVHYRTADLFALPDGWSFALVVEIITIQALPVSLRDNAIAAVARLVVPGGTVLVVENVRDEGAPLSERPPWAFTRAEIASFAEHGLRTVAIDRPGDGTRWRAEFSR